MHKPRRLHPGDTIGVAAPAGAVDDEALSAGVQVLEELGFHVRLGRAVRQRHRYLAGTDAARARDLLEMAADPQVAAIFAARGGYGCGRVLPLVDMEAFRRHPVAVVGHSDLTFLLNDLVQRADLVSFHGPMVTHFAHNREALDSLLAVLTGEPPAPVEVARVLRPGAARGRLAGGCLSIVSAMCGTPCALETGGRLLFLEDVNEAPFRIDRMLFQLREAGALDGVAGLLFGEMPGCFENGGVALEDIVADICTGSYPIVAGMPSGHGRGTLTLPLGVPAEIDGARFRMLESAVA